MVNKKTLEERLIEAASQEGFGHEFNVRKIFEKNNFKCISNKRIAINDELHEIDLIAVKNDYGYLIECKGSSSDSYLILIQEAKGHNARYLRKVETTELISFEGEIKNVISYTGDFFNKNFTRATKNNPRNNFYKATEQVDKSIIAFASDLHAKKSFNNIIPLIAVNCKIYILNYQGEQVEIKECKWALNRIFRVVDSLFHNVQEYLIPVVNISYLQEFLNYLPEQGKIYIGKGEVK